MGLKSTPLSAGAGKCKDCTFWTPWTSYTNGKHIKPQTRRQHFGTCNHPAFHYEHDDNLDEGILWTSDSLVYSDREMYAATFETGEDFGCVQFAARERIENAET